MARSYQVTVGPNKVKLVGSSLGGGLTVTVTNPTGSATDLYIGGDDNELLLAAGATTTTVTSTTGYILKAGSTYGPVRMSGEEAIWGITNTNTVTAYVFRVSGKH